MSKNKLRVGVLMGGKSIEREVSFNSGRTVCDHLDTTRYTVIPIFQTQAGDLFLLPWNFLHRGKTSDFEHRLEHEAKKITWDDLKDLIDFMFIAMHGRFAEDGTLQGFLEVLGIPYLGSKVFGSAVSMNKIMQKNILRANGIAVPKGIHLSPHDITNFSEQKIISQLQALDLQPPYIVKPCNEGSSMGVHVVNSHEQIHAAVTTASTVSPGIHQPVLIEEKIEGMEFTCITITNYKSGEIIPMPPTEVAIEPGCDIFDYDQKYMPGRATEFTPPRCTQETIQKIQNACVAVKKILGMSNTSRTDGFVKKDGQVVIVDPNSLTGMAPSSFLFREAAHIGMSHTQLINHLIETELHAYGMLEAIINQEKKEQKIMTTKKIRVAVLLGGNTNEKEISLESGRNIVYKLSPQKYKPIPIFVSQKMELFAIDQTQLVLNSTTEIEQSLKPEQNIGWQDLKTIADFVFIGLHGGHGENGAVQGTLEMLGVPYNGSSVLASALCADKFKTNQYLKHEGFSVPESRLICKQDWKLNKKEIIQTITKTLPFPLIIKPHDDGCSMMVEKIKTELEKKITQFFRSKKTHVLVEEYVAGMELTVGVIGNEKAQALPPSQAIATQGILSLEEKFLPGAGENQTPAPLPQKTLSLIQKTMERAYEVLGCSGYVRIDGFYQTAAQSPNGQERVIILEVNTLPGMTPATCIFHQAAEIDIRPMDFVDLIVELGIQKHCKIIKKNKILGKKTPGRPKKQSAAVT